MSQNAATHAPRHTDAPDIPSRDSVVTVQGTGAVADLIALAMHAGPEAPHLASLRAAGKQALETHGLPGRRDEGWRFAPTHSWREPTWTPTRVAARELTRVTDADADIVLDAAGCQVRAALPEGVEVDWLSAQATNRAASAAWDKLGRIVPPLHFAALNAALCPDVLWLRLCAGCQLTRPLTLRHLWPTVGQDEAVLRCPRLMVSVEAGARLQLIEHFTDAGQGAQLVVPVCEMQVGAEAHVEHLRLSAGGPQANLLDALGVELADRGHYQLHQALVGGVLSRHAVHITLAGGGAQAAVQAALRGDRDCHAELRVCIDHGAPQTTSQQTLRALAQADGTVVADAVTRVAAAAQGTVAGQQVRSLMLADGATIHAKPHLEIEADDVRCSHGATVGALDPAALFYLQARGVGLEQARALLTAAFIRGFADALPDALQPQGLPAPWPQRLGFANEERL